MNKSDIVMYLCVAILLVVLWIAYVQHRQNEAVKSAFKRLDGARDLVNSVSKTISDVNRMEKIMKDPIQFI